MPPELDYDLRRKQESERKRLNVLQVAGRCFAESGFKKTTMEEVALQAGVSKGLVFHFFGSKQALIKAVIEDGLLQWSTLSEYRASGVEDDSLAELRELFLASFDYVERHPVLLLFARDEEGLGQEYRKQISRRNRLWRERVKKTLKEGVRQGQVRDIDVERVAEVFHQLQTTLLTSASRNSRPPRYDRKTLETAVDIFVAGVSLGAPESPN